MTGLKYPADCIAADYSLCDKGNIGIFGYANIACAKRWVRAQVFVVVSAVFQDIFLAYTL